ncbi:alpha/beta-hydrolase [Aulographum hederae CBS 113979]|uniref:Alpha/beta-hydrolase n=1 Tax=Aulographum hederae CBS 113979 TaxID=1176131 RepID=A0A6G1GM59_9PEZI|nr:alpha/beta-hydrolase [Aulographum hederae CBS 113979]
MSTYPFPYSQAAELDSRIQIPRPIYDPVLAPLLDSASFPEEFDLDLMRGVASGEQECSHGTFIFNADTILKDKPQLVHTEHSVPGPDNNTVILSVFAPKKGTGSARPALYHIHGGGMVSGNRFTAVTPVIDLLEGIDCVVVSVEHRLAPETRAPGPAEDCYAGLVWLSENAASMGIDPAAIVVFGVSGGGALAAATCLMARDRKCPAIPIKAQMLYSPLLDDRCESLSDRQFEYGNPANTSWIRSIWQLILGEARGSNKITPYQAPARETDLSNLPPTYIDAAECEVFRDSAVAFATELWRCGTTCELHIWPGAWHGFDMLNDPNVLLIQMANEAKSNWLKRVMRFDVTVPTASGLHN